MAPLCAEPDDVRAVQHGVEHHQLDGTRKGGLGGSAGRPASRSAQ
jgi:hypothetical protein